MHGKIRIFEQKMKCACPQIWSDAFTSFHVCHSVVYPSPISNISPLTTSVLHHPSGVVAPSSSSSAPFLSPSKSVPKHPSSNPVSFLPNESVPSSAFVPSPVRSVVAPSSSSSAPFLSPSKSVPSSTPSSNPVSFSSPSESVPSSGFVPSPATIFCQNPVVHLFHPLVVIFCQNPVVHLFIPQRVCT